MYGVPVAIVLGTIVSESGIKIKTPKQKDELKELNEELDNGLILKQTELNKYEKSLNLTSEEYNELYFKSASNFSAKEAEEKRIRVKSWKWNQMVISIEVVKSIIYWLIS